MSFYQFLFGSAVIISLFSTGCQSQQVCGRAVRNTRIVGGQNAPPGSWPWQASLIIDGRDACAGSLIHSKWVLTAAHCITGSDLQTTRVLLGRHTQSGPNPHQVSRGLDLIRCHPSYNFLLNDNDICLLKLSAAVNFTDYIQPVCLASARSTFFTGVSSWVIGFGHTQPNVDSRPANLQEVNVPIVGNNECRCAHPRLTANMICAGLSAGGKDACQGDSGASLVTKLGDIWVQSGIVSFGNGCARPNNPGGYARVSQYEDWITNITGSSQPGFVTYISSGVDSDLNFNCSSITTIAPTTPTTAPTTTTTTTSTPMTTRTTPTTPTTTTSTTMTTRTTPTTPATSTTMTTRTTPTTPTTSTTMTTRTTPTTPTTSTTMTTRTTPTTPTTSTTMTTRTTPTTPTTTTETTKDKCCDNGSVFDSGERGIHCSHFTSLCLLVISLFVLGGDT